MDGRKIHVDMADSDRRKKREKVDEEAEREAEAAKLAARASQDSKPEGTCAWEYKFDSDDKKIYGPFTTDAMLGWTDQGYFDESPVLIRQCSDDASEDDFIPIAEVDFSLFP